MYENSQQRYSIILDTNDNDEQTDQDLDIDITDSNDHHNWQ